MLIKKGGVSRNIDERNLDAYKAKGFVPVKAPAPAPDEGKGKNKPAPAPDEESPEAKPAKGE